MADVQPLQGSLPAATAAGTRRGGGDHTLNGGVDDRRQIGGQRALQRKNLHRAGGRRIAFELLDERFDLIQVTRLCSHDDRVRARVGCDQYLCTEVLPFLVELRDEFLHLQRDRTLQVEDLEFGLGIDRSIQFFGQIEDRVEVRFRRDDQQ